MSPYTRLSENIESELIQSILTGHLQPGDELPLEKDLAVRMGVGRSTLRDAVKGLERDGWLDVGRGRASRVRDFWREGNLNVLPGLARHVFDLPDDLIVHLLQFRALIGPAIAAEAVAAEAPRVVAFLSRAKDLTDDPARFAAFDWELQKELARLSPNPVYPLLLNSFDSFYPGLAERYFRRRANRQSSLLYYEKLMAAAMAKDPDRAAEICRTVMEQSITIWLKLRDKVISLVEARKMAAGQG